MENDPKDLSCHLDELERERNKAKAIRRKEREAKDGGDRAVRVRPVGGVSHGSVKCCPPRGLRVSVLPQERGVCSWFSPCPVPCLSPDTMLPSEGPSFTVHPYGSSFLSLFSASTLGPTQEDLACSTDLCVCAFYVSQCADREIRFRETLRVRLFEKEQTLFHHV